MTLKLISLEKKSQLKLKRNTINFAASVGFSFAMNVVELSGKLFSKVRSTIR